MKKVSVLMAVYNEKNDWLINSVESILFQNFSDFEFIIIDDNTSEENKSILKKYHAQDPRIKIITNQKNLGLTRSLNLGLKTSTGEYIARMDSDDIARSDRLIRQLEYLEKNKDLAGCGTAVNLINWQGEKIKLKKTQESAEEIKKIILRYNPIFHSSLIIRSKILKEAGGYDESYPLSQDYELLLRLLKKHQISNLPEPLMDFRINQKGVSYANMKKSLGCALRARWQAWKASGYPRWQIIYLIKPSISYLIPIKLKLLILSNR